MGARKKYVLSVCHKGRVGKSPSESKWQPVQQFACHQHGTCDEHTPSYYSAHVGGWKTWHASGKIRVSTDMPVQVSVYTVRAPAILAVGKNVWQVTWFAIWHWILLFGRNLNVPGPYTPKWYQHIWQICTCVDLMPRYALSMIALET